MGLFPVSQSSTWGPNHLNCLPKSQDGEEAFLPLLHRCAESMLASIGQEKAGYPTELTEPLRLMSNSLVSVSKAWKNQFEQGGGAIFIHCCHDNQHTKLTVLVSFPYRTLLLPCSCQQNLLIRSQLQRDVKVLDVCV